MEIVFKNRDEKPVAHLITSCRIRKDPPLVIVVRSTRAIGMLCNGWSLETLQNEDGIKEGNVLDNATYLTVSQYFNQNLRSPLYSANLVESKTGRLWLKKFFKPRRGEKNFVDPFWGVLGHAPPEKFEN